MNDHSETGDIMTEGGNFLVTGDSLGERYAVRVCIAARSPALVQGPCCSSPSTAGDRRQEAAMAVARVTEIRASSPDGFQEAVLEGLKRASKTLRGLTGLEVLAKRVKVERGKIVEYRVDMKIVFLLE